jgi:hypothetical protein
MINNIRDLYRDISDFKKGYQPRNNTVKDEKGDMVADCHSISARWRNHFSQLLNVNEVNDVKVKVKVTLVQAMRICTSPTAHRRSRGIALPFLNHSTRRG